MGEVALEACWSLPSHHPHHYQEPLENSAPPPRIIHVEQQQNSLPLPKPFLEYLERSGISPSLYLLAQTLPRYIRIKPGLEHEVASLKIELDHKLSPVPWLFGFYSLPHDAQIASSNAYQRGKIYGIDAASGAAVHALGVQEGDHVLDLCAAPGAKLCMVADQLGKFGTLTGVDISRHRLAACRTMLLKYGIDKRCRLFVADGTSFALLPLPQHATNQFPSTKVADGVYREWSSRKTRKQKQCEARIQKAGENPELLFYGSCSGVVGLRKEEIFQNCSSRGKSGSKDGYDKVLVDAECTHDGSLKHISKYERWGWETLERRLLDQERLASITRLQLHLLTNGFSLLKAGGTLVYSTCSLTTSQNEDVVQKFLSSHPNAEVVEIEECKKSKWPCEDGGLCHTLRFNPRTSSTSGLFLAKVKKSM